MIIRSAARVSSDRARAVIGQCNPIGSSAVAITTTTVEDEVDSEEMNREEEVALFRKSREIRLFRTESSNGIAGVETKHPAASASTESAEDIVMLDVFGARSGGEPSTNLAAGIRTSGELTVPSKMSALTGNHHIVHTSLYSSDEERLQQQHPPESEHGEKTNVSPTFG